MEKIAYVQTDQHGLPYSVNGMAAAKGFAFLGYSVRFFESKDLATLPLTRETIVAGGMGTVRSALEQIGIRPPSLTGVPAILSPFLGRESWRTTIHEVRSAGRFPLFVKPYEEAKVFSGQVLKTSADLERLIAPRENFPPISEDFPVLAQAPVSFKSEWRVFIVRGVVIGVNFYTGDPVAFPSATVINMTVGAYG